MKLLGLLKEDVLLADNREHRLIKDGRELLRNNGIPESDIEYFVKRVVSLLDDYAAHFGENTRITYIMLKRFGRLELVLSIPGEEYDPYKNGEGSFQRNIEREMTLNVEGHTACVSYNYLINRNIITGYVPLSARKQTFLRNPNIWAAVLGAVIGLILQKLPATQHDFLMNDVFNPVYDVLLKLLSGIMGPIIFISLMTSIISLDSVNKLTNMGFKLFRRCLRIILFVTVISLLVSILFFGHFGEGNADFSLDQIVTMLLNIIPVNLFSPFVENNTPQLVVLAFVSGLALLLLGEGAKDLNRIIHQLNNWIMVVMKLVCRILPLIPMLSIAELVASGNARDILNGWKYIVASYVVFTFIVIYKIIKTHLVTKKSSLEILKKSKDIIVQGFVTSSTTAPMPRMYEVSEKDLHIKKEFSSFWIPLTSSMMSIKTAVNVILATMMMVEILGLRFSLSFLFVLVILTVEMALASPGTIGSWVIAFEAFSIPSSYIGLFSTYRILAVNYATAVVMAFSMLEQVEAAYKMGDIETPDQMVLAASQEQEQVPSNV